MDNTSRRYTKAYIIALALVAIFIITTQVFIQYLLSNQKKDAHIINISGRQRMLGQKIAKQALILFQVTDATSYEDEKKILQESLNIWNKSHHTLQNGSNTPELSIPQPSEKIQGLFKKLNPYQEEILQAGNNLLKTTFHSPKNQKEVAIKKIIDLEDIFLRSMDEITLEYEKESNQKITRLALIERTLMITVVIILVLEGILIFRPIVSKISSVFKLLETSNQALKNEKTLLKQSIEDLKKSSANLEITQKALLKNKNNIEGQKLLLEVAESVSKTASFDFRFLNKKLIVSENARKLLDLSNKKNLHLDTIIELLKPEDVTLFRNSFSQAIQNNEKVLEGIYQAKPPSEEQWNYYQFFGKIFYGSEDNPIRVLGSVRDITEQISRQKEIEKKQYELQNAYSLLEKSSEAARIGTWEIDLQADKINWNRVAQEIHETGNDFISQQDVIEGTEKWLGFYHSEENQKKIEKALHECLKSGTQFDIESQILTAKGQEKWIRVIGIPAFQKNKIVRLYGLFQDIDERKKIEGELYKLALIAQKTDNLVVVTDGNGEIEWVNTGFTKRTGYLFQEVRGKKPGDLLQGVDTNPEHVQKIKEGLASKESFSQEVLNYTKSGEPYWIDINITPVLDAEGDVIQFIAIEQDITEKKNAEQQIKIKNQQLQIMLHTVEEQKNDILSSIEYAKRIQSATLPKKRDIEKQLPEILLFYKPKDIVSGDFYWFTQIGDISYLTIADCTGHGVPGAFMTIIGISLLEQIINKEQIFSPSQILEELDRRLPSILQTQGIANQDIVDGMEISLLKFDWKASKLIWASAKRPLWVFKNESWLSYKGDIYPIGGSKYYTDKHFTQQVIPLEKGNTVYTFTDGFADQLGGQHHKKLMSNNLQKLVAQNHTLGFEEQEKLLEHYLKDWQGNKEQTDDILIFGIRI